MSNSRELFSPFYEAELAAARSFDVENMNYEQLSALCEKMGTVKCGVSKETFNRIPTRTLYADDENISAPAMKVSNKLKSQPTPKTTTTSSLSFDPKQYAAKNVINNGVINDEKMSVHENTTTNNNNSNSNTIGITRKEELARRLELIKKDPPVDGSAAIRQQRRSDDNHRQQCGIAVNTPTSASLQRKQELKQLSKEACCICMTSLLDIDHDDPDTNNKQSEAAVKRASKIKTLPCKHSFHARCIKEWLMNNKTCPVCKSDVQRQASSVGSLLFQLLPPKK